MRRFAIATIRPSSAAVAGTSAQASSQSASRNEPPDGGAIVIANELSDPEMPIAMPCSWRPTAWVIRLVSTGRSTPLPNAEKMLAMASTFQPGARPMMTYAMIADAKPHRTSLTSPCFLTSRPIMPPWSRAPMKPE